ncbi:LysM peptidoglycan-binding domain-containing protein [Salinimicrobium oceani]|uniref:LysM peptidoglycan-binding domain-containing protein n=1 Tax=Salinimicrobium oceani TaxID=2722702 RepID=A0ABX1CZE8_9FLAO|nr:LysM peptidoglycan-binding domain-containing protein [Salinimicrobium oceani]NJW51686.1 LysM peptidoglycan-binding domain-containing protein [Salinimicrobium oceani]
MKKIALLFLIFQFFVLQSFAQQYKYHIVKAGETTSDIARQYNISEETIFKYNPDARRGLKPNAKLVVPIGAEREQQPSNGEKKEQQHTEFEMHRVKKQETLFSLSQQYNVSIEDIKKYNKHLYSQELKKGEKIRIPKASSLKETPLAPPSGNILDLSLKEHVVLPQETLYGISRKYNITIADLQRLNPTMQTLQPGMVIKVKNGNVEKVVEVEGPLFKYYQVQPQETLFSLTRRFGISRDSLVSLNPALADGLKSGMVLKIPNNDDAAPVEEYEEADVVNLERRISNYEPKNLVVMLPFNKNKIVTTDSTSNVNERIRKDRVMQISLDFYSGVLMAIDSARTLGISTNVTFLDTEGNSGKVNRLLNSHNFSNVDAVIGPLVQSTVETAARGLESRNIPVISPLTKKEAGSLDNFLQTVPTDEMLADAMISYISENANGKNLVIIADAGAVEKRRKLTAAFPAARMVTPREGGNISQAEMAAALDKSRPNWVILESTKIGVLSNATSYLNSIAGPYNITLLTTDRNSSFDSDNISNTHLGKLNFHYPSVERSYDPSQNRNFIKKYSDKYGVVPNRYAVRGFDVTYDVLLRLASAPDLYSSINEEGTTQYVENKFDYDLRPAGGYINKAIYILAYDRNLNLNAVR